MECQRPNIYGVLKEVNLMIKQMKKLFFQFFVWIKKHLKNGNLNVNEDSIINGIFV